MATLLCLCGFTFYSGYFIVDRILSLAPTKFFTNRVAKLPGDKILIYITTHFSDMHIPPLRQSPHKGDFTEPTSGNYYIPYEPHLWSRSTRITTP